MLLCILYELNLFTLPTQALIDVSISSILTSTKKSVDFSHRLQAYMKIFSKIRFSHNLFSKINYVTIKDIKE